VTAQRRGKNDAIAIQVFFSAGFSSDKVLTIVDVMDKSDWMHSTSGVRE
jgi:hypothetical protein